MFQERLNAVPGCVDDIVRRGVDSKDHDVNLFMLFHMLFETARMNGIKFNPKKLQFKTTQCEFFWQTLTPMGIRLMTERWKP